jgi:hypothetical protein
VKRRAGGVLERIADCVADDRGLVGIRALAAQDAGFDVFLGVVPGAACLKDLGEKFWEPEGN